jgi:hypothetical protein
MCDDEQGFTHVMDAVTWEPLAPNGRDGRLLRVYRFAVDDLRLFKAIHEAGMLGRIVVVDRISQADVVLATQHRRTGKEASLIPVSSLGPNPSYLVGASVHEHVLVLTLQLA